MKKNLIAAFSTLAFALSVTSAVTAADAEKVPGAAASEPQPALYTAKCPSPCDFTVKSHDKKEVASVLKEHAKAHHDGMVLSDADCDSMIKVATPKK
ncbi:MAG: putative small metal-binding protein [Verrucomicrobia bacterium]|nr:putative small metal-binding protein [Verrucomicrobiota bacterium]